MKLSSIATHKIIPEESILGILEKYLKYVPECSVVAITSKIISLCQNRVVSKKNISDKFELVKQESDLYLEGDYSKKYGICLTIKNKLLIPTAGIDESNGNGYYILYPENIQAEAAKIWEYLKQRHSLKQVGVLITDSHTTPLRRGVTGIMLGWCGFKPLRDYIGEPDIYGEKLRVTLGNVVDSLSASAVFMMGEGKEQTPIVLIEDLPQVTFQDRPPNPEEINSVSIALDDDLYAPLLQAVDWKVPA